MINNEHITYIDYPLDMDKMREIAKKLKPQAQPYKPKHYVPKPGQFDFWKRVVSYKDDYICKIMSDFEVEKGITKFYWQEPNSFLKPHIDYGSPASLNFIISDEEDNAPVSYDDNHYYYRQALINTSIPHYVINGPRERILFKISIKNETYQDLSKRIKYKK